MNKIQSKLAAYKSRRILGLAAFAAVVQISPAFAGTTGSEVTISTAGSTALKNWFVKNSTTFTDIQPGNTLSIGGTQYPSANTSGGGTGLGAGEWNINGGTAFAYQLAPKSYAGASLIEGSTTDSATALRFEYHESGSVEGILELANDQIAPVTYVTQNINRDPNSGNAVWVNYNQFGGGNSAWNPATGTGTVGGYTLGEFYNGSGFTLGGTARPSFNLSGGNINGGQNAVQLAVADSIPIQAFAPDNNTESANPWTTTPSTPGYGQGNTKLSASGLGVANVRTVLQNASALNMSAGAINPRTGAAFGTGPWNSAETGNLTTRYVASTATLYVANPGTGATKLDRTDAQWLETTGRLQNGATFDMTTRDVNSGTHNVAAVNVGIDPAWAVGVNDDGNGNATDGATQQITIGGGLRFSNKTAGGGLLRPTVQTSRMAIGTLSINDASGFTVPGKANPLRALTYSDSTNGSSPYILANYANISTGAYVIFQNEQFVTVNAPDITYGTANQNIQGDTPTGDVKALIANTQNSVIAAFNGSSAASPVAGLEGQGYIPPQLMQVKRAQDGLNIPGSASQIVTNIGTGLNTQYNSSIASGSAFNSLTAALAMGDPTSVTAGGSSLYGANSVYGGVTSGNFAGATGFVDQISITSANYLFGNFNQNGVRDFSAAVVSAQKAQAALDTNPAGTSAFNGSSNTSVITTGISALDAMPSQNGTASGSNTTGTGATKGDLIVMGDYNGDGAFNGRDLYSLAVGASLSNSGNRPVLNLSGGTTTILSGTGTITVPGGGTFGDVIASSVLNKNVALDYLQAVATTSQKTEARAILTGATSNASTGVPAGATFVGYEANTVSKVQFTYDATGTNAFNKSDVNQDGVVDFNDALVVDNSNGLSPFNLSNALTTPDSTAVAGPASASPAPRLPLTPPT